MSITSPQPAQPYDKSELLQRQMELYEAGLMDAYDLATNLIGTINKGKSEYENFTLATRFCTILLGYLHDNPEVQTDDLKAVFAEIEAVNSAIDKLVRAIDEERRISIQDPEASQLVKRVVDLTDLEKQALLSIAAISANMREIILYALANLSGQGPLLDIVEREHPSEPARRTGKRLTLDEIVEALGRTSEEFTMDIVARATELQKPLDLQSAIAQPAKPSSHAGHSGPTYWQ